MTLSPISLEAAQRAFRNSDRLDRPTEASVFAAIEAFLAAEAERGARLMPFNPTPEMLKAGGERIRKANPALSDDNWKAVSFDGLAMWRAMFDTAASEQTSSPKDQDK